MAPSSLTAGASYQVVARIWNRSFGAPVAGLTVAFSYLSFGVGVGEPIRLDLSHVNLGVIGGPRPSGLRGTGTGQLQSTPGHYCIQVTLAARERLGTGKTISDQENTPSSWPRSRRLYPTFAFAKRYGRTPSLRISS